jgi:hypothetical protein
MLQSNSSKKIIERRFSEKEPFVAFKTALLKKESNLE